MTEYNTMFWRGEDVLCDYAGGILLYEAKIDKIRHGETECDTKYFVHYKGWNKRYDEWLNAKGVHKINDENLAKQKQLAKELKDRKADKKKEKPLENVSSVPIPKPSLYSLPGEKIAGVRNKRKADSQSIGGASSTRSTFLSSATSSRSVKPQTSITEQADDRSVDNASEDKCLSKKSRKDVTSDSVNVDNASEDKCLSKKSRKDVTSDSVNVDNASDDKCLSKKFRKDVTSDSVNVDNTSEDNIVSKRSRKDLSPDNVNEEDESVTKNAVSNTQADSQSHVGLEDNKEDISMGKIKDIDSEVLDVDKKQEEDTVEQGTNENDPQVKKKIPHKKHKETSPLVTKDSVKCKPIGRPRSCKTGNDSSELVSNASRARSHWKQLMEERIVDSVDYHHQQAVERRDRAQAFPVAMQRIRLTDPLKSCLNHDEELVEQHKKLAKLPPEKSVRHIIEDYCQFRSNKASSDDRKARVAKFAAYMIKSFNAYAPLLLLFQFEKLQFIEATSDYPNLELADLYGFPHLLRFLAILDCITCTVSKSLCRDQEFSVNVHDFIRYLTRHTNVLFNSSLYIDKPPRYHRMAYF